MKFKLNWRVVANLWDRNLLVGFNRRQWRTWRHILADNQVHRRHRNLLEGRVALSGF
jgi:hypothetical protein